MSFFFSRDVIHGLPNTAYDNPLPSNIKRFYYAKKGLEFTFKASIVSSLAFALLIGGPAAPLIGSAALMIKLGTTLFNHIQPHDILTTSQELPATTIPVSMTSLLNPEEPVLTSAQDNQIEQFKDISFYIVLSFIALTSLSAGISPLTTLALTVLLFTLCETSKHLIEVDEQLLQTVQI